MDIMSSMEFALCVGTQKASTFVSKRIPRWSAAFRTPVDAALHVGTPKPTRLKQEKSVSSDSSHFFGN